MDGPWRDYVAVLFIIFVVLMTIIMMNLITGLALDDIQKIAENAEYKKLAMQVGMINCTPINEPMNELNRLICHVRLESYEF